MIEKVLINKLERRVPITPGSAPAYTQTRPWYRDDRKIGRRYRGGTHGGHVLRAAPGEAEPKPTQPAGLEASKTTWRARRTRASARRCARVY